MHGKSRWRRRLARAAVIALALAPGAAVAEEKDKDKDKEKEKVRVKWDAVSRILEFNDGEPADRKLVYFYYHVQHQDPFTVRDRLAPYLTPPAKITCVDHPAGRNPGSVAENHNVLIIEDTRANIERHRELLRRVIDVPRPQVLIEAKITEITYSRDFEFGFEGAYESVGERTFFRGFDLSFNPVSYLDFQRRQTQGSARLLPFQGVTLDFKTLDNTIREDGRVSAVGNVNEPAVLRMLARQGKAQILSRPRIMVREGETGKLETGAKLPVPTATVNPGGAIQLNPRPEEVVTKLTVKPLVVGEDTMYLDVNPSFAEVTGFTDPEETGGLANPIIQTREVQTRVFLRDRQTLIIGGLFSDSYVVDTAEVPFLGDIPIVGQLFKSHRRQRVKTELVFFVTPTIFRAGGVTPGSLFAPSEKGGRTDLSPRGGE
ncbi:MAG: type II and III secretion system protein [Planctomycetes bacterium]|nr:type II and III secretion system protein [Planctomycetota bacterium]